MWFVCKFSFLWEFKEKSKSTSWSFTITILYLHMLFSPFWSALFCCADLSLRKKWRSYTLDGRSQCYRTSDVVGIPTKLMHRRLSSCSWYRRSYRIKSRPHKKQTRWSLVRKPNYTDWATATCRQNLVPTFVDRGVSRSQRGGSPTVINLSFLDRSRYFSFQ
jgi:hypothetical protein